MNSEQFEGQWHQFKGKLKERWGKLTDDDVKVVAGKRDMLIGKVQERYGVLKKDAEEQVDQWMSRLESSGQPSKSETKRIV